MESIVFAPSPSRFGRGELPGRLRPGSSKRRGDPLGKHVELPQASKECPQPQELVALGF
jgi:hypothetical protein